GVVSVASNIVPQDVAALVSRFHAGDVAGARALHQKLYPLIKALFCEPNPVPVKHARKLLGRGGDQIRPPLSPMTAESAARLQKALGDYGLLPS
ncbi:dihydrodipicolinate synthase family protein, partial [Planctomycetota bacterium]